MLRAPLGKFLIQKSIMIKAIVPRRPVTRSARCKRNSAGLVVSPVVLSRWAAARAVFFARCPDPRLYWDRLDDLLLCASDAMGVPSLFEPKLSPEPLPSPGSLAERPASWACWACHFLKRRRR